MLYAKTNTMQLVYLQFGSLASLKKFTEKFPLKKVFIMLDKKVLLAQFTEKEIEFAIEQFEAEVINTAVA
jgi:adenylate cyclase class IV